MDKTVIKPYEELDLKIYAYTLPEVPNHSGYIKIGDTFRSVEKRIFEQVGTVGLNPQILFKKVAQKSDGTWFHDKSLHRFLLLNGVEKKNFNGYADEWFYFNGTPENAEILTDKYINQDYDEVQIDDNQFSYLLRREQQAAVEETLQYYLSGQEPREFLWNAKPRFGKTLTTYDFIRQVKATNVLIVTNRPAIANSWLDDFKKFISWQEPDMKFVSETDALNGKALTRQEYREFLNNTKSENPTLITFISLQDLKGAKFAGGVYEKLEWVGELSWDLLVIDEAHEGVDTLKTDTAFNKINKRFTLHLSGTPFKALANNKFNQNQIFNWSYVDEQESKINWDYTLSSNPYENLPSLSLFTYQMSKMIEDEISQGVDIGDYNVDFAFDLNEFFRASDDGIFEYETSVLKFLDNLSSGKFPFSTDEHRNELNHTFWLLPRVNSAKALEKLLKKHDVFKDYKIILAAGDGISVDNDLDQEFEDPKRNEKSFNKVKTAIVENEKTITLSVGQLTTGVTIPEWSAILMLNNIKSPSLYFQAAFRAQNPYEFEKNGKLYRKENAYIFDFAPERTLLLYDEFANNLSNESSRTSEDRKQKIRQLLNFFPVIAEDAEGNMHEINATEVLTIPTRITSMEVVKRKFMSNLLFANIAGIFSGDSPFKDILDKIKPEKNKRLTDRREINVTTPMLDVDGNVDIPEDIVINKTKDIFGEKIYKTIDIPAKIEIPAINEITKKIANSLDTGFSNLKDQFNLNKTQTDKAKNEVLTVVNDVIKKNIESYQTQIQDIEDDYTEKITLAQDAQDQVKALELETELTLKKVEVNQAFTQNLNAEVGATVETAVEKQLVKVEEKKKKTTEDDVRDHLRGFARTIPAFLMAYGTDTTTLATFEENIDETTFEKLTSITITDFIKLRDGFEYSDEVGEHKIVPGLFNEVVFDASIREFFNTKRRLSNYFDETLTEDIFDYIPPQETNQIFTPKEVVKVMCDLLQENCVGIFNSKEIKFIDLYTKSGLYITEIVKRLNEGLKHEIPDEIARIKWILENQVYTVAPSNIIYNIAKNYIYGNFIEVSTDNIIECNLTDFASEGTVIEILREEFGDDKLNFDVVIGNPPYQEETAKKATTNGQKSVKNIFQNFQTEADKLATQYVNLIYPGGRWIHRSGKGLKNFGYEQINDPRLEKIIFYPKANEVFRGVGIDDGISIVLKNMKKTTDTFEYVYSENGHKKAITITNPGEDLIPLNPSDKPILDKINDFVNKNNLDYLSNSLFSRSLFAIESDFAENHPNKVKLYNGGNFDTSKYIKLFTNDKAGAAGRATWFLADRSVITTNREYIDEWQVVVSSAHPGGQQKRDNQIGIMDNHSAFGRSRLALKSFKTLKEAENFLEYANSILVRFTFLMTDESISSLAKKSPDILDYTESNRFIDFTNNIDKQLYSLIGLSDEEIKYIETMVKNSR